MLTFSQIPGSVVGTIEYRRSTCWCLWYSCDWIHTPTRLEFFTCFIQNLFSCLGHSFKSDLSLQVHGMMYLKSLLYCT